MKPVNNNIFIRKLEANKRTAGGLYIPDSANNQMLPAAEVVEVGPECKTVKQGDRIFIKWLEVFAVHENGVDGFLVSEDSVLAII